MGEYEAEFFHVYSVYDVVVGGGVYVFTGFEDLDLGIGDESFDGFFELVDEDNSVGDDEGLETDFCG